MVSKKDQFNWLPENLPEPKDDGACDHLVGMKLPSVALQSTRGGIVDPSKVNSKYVIIFCYPITGSPTNSLLETYFDEWKSIPGA